MTGVQRPALALPSAGLVLLAALVTVLSEPASASSDRVDLARVDPSGFAETGTITFFMDVLDPQGNVISDVEADKVEVFIDDKPVPGEVSLQTAAEAREWVAVAILVAGHRSYAPLEDETGPNGEPVATGPNVFELQKRGFGNFLSKLEGNDRVSIYLYNELRMQVIDNWSEDHATAARRLDANARLLTKGIEIPAVNTKAPELYKAIKEIVEERFGDDQVPEGRRRILLVMSDGFDIDVYKDNRLRNRIQAIADSAVQQNVKVFAVGYSASLTEPLIHLQGLANRTRGVYREILSKDADTIPQVLENIAVQLKRQYVVTFTPTEDWDPPEKAASFMVRVTTGTERVLEDEYPATVRIPARPGPGWPTILMWAGIALGGLLLLIVLIKVIKAIASRPRRQAVEPQGPEQYIGPYLGKLACIDGPAAGHDFFIIEDVTTIGSIDGNSIVLPNPSVSKRHAGIKVEDLRFELADFGSTNKTYVNGREVVKQFLADGDEVRIGEFVFRFSLK